MGKRSSPMTTDTDFASGRSARTVTRPFDGCAPSTACGLWWAPPISRSSSLVPISMGRVAGVAVVGPRRGFCVGDFAERVSRGSVTGSGPSGSSGRWDRSGHEAFDGTEGDRQPGRTMSSLVDHLIDGLVHLVCAQKYGRLARVCPRTGCVAVTERLTVAFCPLARPVREL